ncbi:diacylglycerol kinase [Gorillibacterium massiliense]|uniref:diacylglycerol kinase n=1 Tax=Gorillibacterium massiliense TaxID=1280390 RepID=UPI0004B70391|nr:diacylglycerol kinase [Gorillibacterium massiliense]
MKQGIRFLRSMRYAYEGIKYALTTQPNMKIHFFVSFLVLAAAVLFGLSRNDILFLLLAITLVIVTELINTAIEKTVDLAMPDRHPLAKIAKDTAAAAVLVTAAFAVAVGLIIFYRPVELWLQASRLTPDPITAASVWIYLIFVLLTVIVAETRFSKRSKLAPSLLSAVAFSLSTLISLMVDRGLPVFLSYALAVLTLLVLYHRRSRRLISLLFGAILGTAITLLIFSLHRLSIHVDWFSLW